MANHVLHTWQEVVNAIKPLEGKTLHSGARLRFKVLEISESQILVERSFPNGNSQIINITKAWQHIYEKIEKNGRYSLHAYQAMQSKLHRYYVYVMANESRGFFQVVHNNIETTDSIYYADTFRNISKDVTDYEETLQTANRIIAIVGAGAAVELGDKESPSSRNLTKHIIEDSDSGTAAILKQIQKTIANKYKENFEAYFHIVEQFVAFYYDWEKSEDKEYGAKHPLSRFIKPNRIFDPKQKKKQPKEVLRQMLIQLMDQIDVYNRYFIAEKDNKLSWYKDFWCFIKDFKWDVFTFNYDTTIEACLENNYTDGFWSLVKTNDRKRFEPIKYLDDRKENKHTINHIHGCLLYSGEKPDYKQNSDIQEVYTHDQYKWKDYQTNKQQIENRDINIGRSQSGDVIIQDSIITGLHKTDKIISQPYSFYRTQLDTQLLNNNRVLIIGYSFNDFYVNNILESVSLYHLDYRIVIVDFFSLENLENWKENAMAKFFSEHPEKVYMSHFIEKMMQTKDASSNVWENFDYTHCSDNYIVSKSNQIMIFMGGFKDASSHKEIIYEFLTAKF